MERRATVTYHHHSGFSVQVESTLLVFDYWEGEKKELAQYAKLTAESFKEYTQVFVFVSHAHPDHLDQVIYTWLEGRPITYIVSADTPIGTPGKRLAAGDSLLLAPDVRVTAYGSTDLGVSFLVDAFGLRIFHAGDLNLWHWREESSLKEIEMAEKAFEEAVKPLIGQRIDLCMFPVDPRMGAMFDAGANYFILSVKPRLLLPMHWQGRSEVAVDFARRARNKLTEVVAMTKPGERAQITFDDAAIYLRIVEPPEAKKEEIAAEALKEELPVFGGGRTPAPQVTLEAYNENDPFADTDLPVSLDDK
jgi:L-ascorbate metabolism protein UlaG (beta-lactamase superfamily)